MEANSDWLFVLRLSAYPLSLLAPLQPAAPNQLRLSEPTLGLGLAPAGATHGKQPRPRAVHLNRPAAARGDLTRPGAGLTIQSTRVD